MSRVPGALIRKSVFGIQHAFTSQPEKQKSPSKARSPVLTWGHAVSVQPDNTSNLLDSLKTLKPRDVSEPVSR